ncbi:MAG TPA: CHRD domain-containing protein [Casimicrobiaceae bacterium]|nr:CHRD domain-containing protein [Casimicrobiaceae bacterium]
MTHIKQSMLAAATFATGAFFYGVAFSADVKVVLSGANEVPPVTTSATGEGTISVADDGSVSGSVTTKGVPGTAAHIHIGAAGKNGPVVVPFTKDGDTYKAPAGAKLTAEQMTAFKAGELYFNVHSAANPGGEIRGQLK